MREAYPSDITREQFEVIRHIIESSRKVTHPMDYDLYDIFCAVLYVLREGCKWRALPHDYPKWNDVYYHFMKWSQKRADGSSILSEVLNELVQSERIIKGRQPKTTMIIVDSKSIKNTDTAEEKGYDGGKKVSGIKVHLAVDTNGLPHAINVTTANINDREGALEMLKICAPNLTNVVKVLCDGGYTGEDFAIGAKSIIDAAVEIAKRSELHKFSVIPKRWVVERSNAWLEKFRRLWKNCERKIQTSLQMTTLAFVALLLKRY